MKSILASIALLSLLMSGCATYKQAKDINLVSFDGDLNKGKAVGPIRGEDCVWSVLGNPLGGAPTLDRAFMNARMNRSSSALGDSLSSDDDNLNDGVRYINKVSTENVGWDAIVVGKNCLVVRGVGYR